MKYLKDVGIDVKLNTKEYGAYISTTFYGKFDSMGFGPQTGFLEPDNFLYGQYYPGELKNQSHFNDPVVADLLIRQRRTARPRQAQGADLRDPALSRQAAVLRAAAVARARERVGRRAQELRAELRLRLRRPPHSPPGSTARAGRGEGPICFVGGGGPALDVRQVRLAPARPRRLASGPFSTSRLRGGLARSADAVTRRERRGARRVTVALAGAGRTRRIMTDEDDEARVHRGEDAEVVHEGEDLGLDLGLAVEHRQRPGAPP